MIIWDIVLSNRTEIIPKVLDNTPFLPPTILDCRGFIFYFLCLDHRHKQNYSVDQLELHVPHDHKL